MIWPSSAGPVSGVHGLVSLLISAHRFKHITQSRFYFLLLYSSLFSSSFLMRVFLSYVLSLICEAVLCLELFLFAELGQAHDK